MEPAPPRPPTPESRRVLVGLDLDGETLRYAAVAHAAGQAPELVRLGAASFDRDLAAGVLGAHADTEATDLLGRAAADALRGLQPYAVHVVAHAPHLPSFFVPVAAGLPAGERYDRLRRETALLADAEVGPVLRVRSRPVRLGRLPRSLGTGGQVVWHRTLHVPNPLHERLDALARRLGAVGRGGPRYDVVDGAEAAAALVVEAEGEIRRGGQALSLSVGLYDAGAELGICQGGRLYYSRRIDAGPRGRAGLLDDLAYFAAALVDRLGLDAEHLDRVYLYGPSAVAADVGRLAELFAAEVQELDPGAPFGRRFSRLDPALVPAVGAALGER